MAANVLGSVATEVNAGSGTINVAALGLQAGDLLVLALLGFSSGSNMTWNAPTDNATPSNTYVIEESSDSPNPTRSDAAFAIAKIVNVPTIVNIDGGGGCGAFSAVALRVAGHDAATPFDGGNHNADVSATPTASGYVGANGTPLVLVCVTHDGADLTSISPPAGFTMDKTDPSNAIVTYGVAHKQMVAAQAGAGFQWTLNTGSRNAVMATLGIASAAGGGGQATELWLPGPRVVGLH